MQIPPFFLIVAFIGLSAVATNDVHTPEIHAQDITIMGHDDIALLDDVAPLDSDEVLGSSSQSVDNKGALDAGETSVLKKIAESSKQADDAAAELVEAETKRAALKANEAVKTEQATQKKAELEKIDAEKAEVEKKAAKAKADEQRAVTEKEEAEKQKRAAQAETRRMQHEEAAAEREATAANRTAARIKQELIRAKANFNTKRSMFDKAKLRFENATALRAMAEQDMRSVADALGLTDASWRTAQHGADAAFKTEEAGQHAMFDARMRWTAANNRADQAQRGMTLLSTGALRRSTHRMQRPLRPIRWDPSQTRPGQHWTRRRQQYCSYRRMPPRCRRWGRSWSD